MLLCFYLALEVSSCTLERNFSELRRFVDTHCGASQADSNDIEAALELRLDGPQVEEEVCLRKCASTGTESPGLLRLSKKVQVSLAVDGSESPLLELNAFSRRLAELWIEHHGRRFHVYRKRQDSGLQKGPREGTESSLIAAQKRARSKLSQGLGHDSKGLFGSKRTKLAWKGSLEDNEVYKKNEAMQVFHKRSEKIMEKHLDVRKAKLAGCEPYPVGGLYDYNSFDIAFQCWVLTTIISEHHYKPPWKGKFAPGPSSKNLANPVWSSTHDGSMPWTCAELSAVAVQLQHAKLTRDQYFKLFMIKRDLPRCETSSADSFARCKMSKPDGLSMPALVRLAKDADVFIIEDESKLNFIGLAPKSLSPFQVMVRMSCLRKSV